MMFMLVMMFALMFTVVGDMQPPPPGPPGQPIDPAAAAAAAALYVSCSHHVQEKKQNGIRQTVKQQCPVSCPILVFGEVIVECSLLQQQQQLQLNQNRPKSCEVPGIK